MLDNGTKRRIDNARDILVGKVPDPKAQVEQITTALIYKFMDDMDQESIALGGKASFFVGEYAKYAWPKVIAKSHSGYERLVLYSEAITRMSQNRHLPQLFRDIFKGAFLPYRDPETLNLFLKEIDGFKYDNSERLGDAFEYLLSIMGSQGAAGQFRTPRHIIDFIVEVVAPTKTDTVLDPACGTAGFLISAYKHILARNQEKKLSPDEMLRLTKNFVGYDISPDMVRLSLVNMYLHQFQNPTVFEYDTLTSEERWDDCFDIILANPPFMSPKGGIRPHTRFAVQAKRSEVLFVDYIAEHLNPGGRAGVIVPEGIIFQSAKAYKALRKMLIEENYLYAVVSMPSGVFNPYSGVKTSILLMDRTLAKRTDSILFVNIENDGYGLGAQRREIVANDIPEALRIIKDFQNNPKSEPSNLNLAHIVAKSKIVEDGDFNLTSGRYKELFDYSKVKWPLVAIREFAEVISGQSPESKYYNENGEGTPFYQGKIGFTEKYLGEPRKWTNKVTKLAKKNDILISVRAPVGPVNIAKDDLCIGRGLAAIRLNKEKVLVDFIFHLLKQHQEYIHGNKGTTFASINRKEIESIKFPLPPLKVQQAIVDEVEEYQKIIDGARQVVENYRPRIKVDPDWPLVGLGEVTSRITDGSHFSPKTVDKGYSYVTVRDIDDGKIDTINCKKISEEDFLILVKNNCQPVKNDVLFSKDGTVGKVALVENNEEFVVLSSLAIITPNLELLVSKYLSYILKNPSITEKALRMKKGVAIRRVILRDLKRLQIPLPCKNTQEIIIAQLEEEKYFIDGNKGLIEIFEKKIEEKIGEVWGEE